MKNLFAGKTLAALMIGIVATTFAFDADAQRRFGGGKNLGRQSAPVQQRQATPPQQQTPQAGNPQQAPAAAAAQRPGATPAAAPRSPWRGALMGLAAGLGIAALASYLGFGEALTMFLTALLIGMVLLVIVGFILRRVSRPRTSSSVIVRWCGVASHVTCTPRAFAAATAVIDSRAERCWKWTRASS